MFSRCYKTSIKVLWVPVLTTHYEPSVYVFLLDARHKWFKCPVWRSRVSFRWDDKHVRWRPKVLEHPLCIGTPKPAGYDRPWMDQSITVLLKARLGANLQALPCRIGVPNLSCAIASWLCAETRDEALIMGHLYSWFRRYLHGYLHGVWTDNAALGTNDENRGIFGYWGVHHSDSLAIFFSDVQNKMFLKMSIKKIIKIKKLY